MLTIGDRSRCLRGKSGIVYHRKQCLECGSEIHVDESPQVAPCSSQSCRSALRYNPASILSNIDHCHAEGSFALQPGLWR
jgi:hypothetical protein